MLSSQQSQERSEKYESKQSATTVSYVITGLTRSQSPEPFESQIDSTSDGKNPVFRHFFSRFRLHTSQSKEKS